MLARVAVLGRHPRVFPRRPRVVAVALAAAIETALHDGAMRERAEATGATVRAENGLVRAVDAIERSTGGQSGLAALGATQTARQR